MTDLFTEFKRRNGFAGAPDDALVTRDFTRAWSVRHWLQEAAPQLAAARRAGVARGEQEAAAG